MKHVLLVVVLAVASAAAQQPPPGAPQGRGRGSGRGTGPVRPEPLSLADHTGFESIFDGSSMKGWDGDPEFWRAENGALVGRSTIEHPLKQNTFLIWRGGEPKDFEL